MNRLLFCLLLFNITHSGFASLKWYDGVVVLHNNHILVGKLAVEPSHDLVLFSHPDSLGATVLPAFKIKAANFFDAEHNINRRFVSIEDKDFNTGYKLYEVVIKGTIWVVRRPERYHSVPLRDDECSYYAWENGELTALKKFGTLVYNRLDRLSKHQLSSFVRLQRLDPHQQADAIRIIQYFNSLEIPVTVLSRKQ